MTMDGAEPATDAELQDTIWTQASAHVRAQIREEVRSEAWAEMRTQSRFAIAGLVVISLVIGGLIGYFGFHGGAANSRPALTPPAQWVSTGGQLSAGGPGSASGSEGETSVPTPWPVRVYVSGAVIAPQVVELPGDSLVEDALAAAGGPAADADLDELNLAAPLFDNQHIEVPRLTAKAGVSPSNAAMGTVTPRLININTASTAELQSLPGIGPTRAQEIVAYRDAHGSFEQPEDLLGVPGIGPVTLERIVSLISLDP